MELNLRFSTSSTYKTASRKSCNLIREQDFLLIQGIKITVNERLWKRNRFLQIIFEKHLIFSGRWHIIVLAKEQVDCFNVTTTWVVGHEWQAF